MQTLCKCISPCLGIAGGTIYSKSNKPVYHKSIEQFCLSIINQLLYYVVKDKKKIIMEKRTPHKKCHVSISFAIQKGLAAQLVACLPSIKV
jgi:hypothetical protein